MIRKAIYKFGDNSNQQISQQAKNEYDIIWGMYKEVIATGDSFVYYPNTPKQDLQKIWFAPYMNTYIYENQNGEILGSYLIKPNQPDLGSHVANASFMVNPKFQGQGIGTKLCQHCLQTAKELGYKYMQFNIVVSTNTSAIAVWKKFGFQIIGTIPQAFNNLNLGKYVDAYIMYRKL